MQLFKLKTRISKFDDFAAFATGFRLSERDMVITNEFLYDPFMAPLNLPCRFVMQEKFGTGEPSDEMMNRILETVHVSGYDRIIAVGGGTVIDIAKIFALKDVRNVTDAFERKIPVIKARQLVILPTTCGTGSEVTNISIAEIKSKHTKMGLADDALAADDAVLVAELLKGLPFKFYACSAIDALIHALESYVSPASNPYTQPFCNKAIGIILDVFRGIAEQGPEYRFQRLEDMLMASNFAGIAFGNTGVGAVHALSYPLGGMYHVPHGEANYQFLTAVFRLYNKKNPNGRIRELNAILSQMLSTESDPYQALGQLLDKILPRPALSTYGMKPEDVPVFTENVLTTQQRLLANNYVELSPEEIYNIYQQLLESNN